jgi:hypothetical protein
MLPFWREGLLGLFLMFSATRGSTIASVSALYSFSIDPSVVSTDLIDRFATAFNRTMDPFASTPSFSIVAFEGLGVVPCSQLTSIPQSPITGITIGCSRVRFNISENSNLTRYEVKYYTEFWPLVFASKASHRAAGFYVEIAPSTLEPPQQIWVGPPDNANTSFATWLHRTFPQDRWVKQNPNCVSGVACEYVNIAPSVRYQHTAVVYKSWNFKRDVLPHPSLCYLNQNNSGCTETCLRDPSCFGAPDWDTYFSTNAGSYLWGNTRQFFSDDGLDSPVSDVHSATCPPACCGTRRMCMRTHDDMGRLVPFDRSYMLVFGGRTRQKEMVNGTDVYLDCTTVLANAAKGDQTYASCLEYQSEELWRYDIEENVWEQLKPRTLSSDGSFPAGRYGHASALVIIDAQNDLQATRRQYMFVFGGFSTDCSGGLCTDLWRYEIPWAAQAFWPATSQTLGRWNRGNVWKQMSGSPVGGIFRHSMVATQSGSALLVYGGQLVGNYSDSLLVYTLSSDSWEIKKPFGYRYFTRSTVDYLGRSLNTSITSMEKFLDDVPTLDQLGPLAQQVNGGQMPLQRADHCALMLSNKDGQSMFIFEGFRTYGSPYPKDGGGPYPNYPYYLDGDMWTYNVSKTYWKQMFVNSDEQGPPVRRGTACLVLPRETGDDLLLVFGGSRADDLMNDFWTLEVQKEYKSERIWQRIDGKWNGTLPDPVTYHSMVYDSSSEQLIVFGGLRWTQANLTATDIIVDNDRRCSVAAVNVLVTSCSAAEITNGNYSSGDECAIVKAKDDISTKCASSGGGFCCSVTLSLYSTLQALSGACLNECQENAFQSAFSAYFGEGIWVMSPNNCANDCSGNGQCELSVCTCKPGFTGTDCSIRICPGSFCYFDSVGLDKHCVSCSSNGFCQTDGTCLCQDGWTGDDCSSVVCQGNCSASGVCLSTLFPLNQCVCDPTFSGYDCSQRLCLNACSYRGNCSTDGTCSCQDNFYGDDCSVYIFAASAGVSELRFLITVVTLLVLLL